MTGRKFSMLLIGALAIGCGAYYFVRATKCDDIVGKTARSPNGKSIAISTLKACPIGFLSATSCSVSVALTSSAAASSLSTTSPIFVLADASEEPELNWANDHQLILRIDDIGAVQASEREVRGISISYIVTSRIWNVLEKIEADQLQSHQESQELYKVGKLSKSDLHASLETEDAMAKERADFRQWVITNATVEDLHSSKAN